LANAAQAFIRIFLQILGRKNKYVIAIEILQIWVNLIGIPGESDCPFGYAAIEGKIPFGFKEMTDFGPCERGVSSLRLYPAQRMSKHIDQSETNPVE
jgi:hypothetical protein